LVDKLQTEYQTILQTHGRVEKLQAQVRELEEGKSTLESQLESSTGVLISLEKLLNESRNRVEVLERENVGLTQDKEKLEKADLEAKGQVSSLIDRMQALQDQLSVLLSQKQSELAVYEDEISVLRGNVSRLEKENTQYQQQNLKFLEQARIFGEIIIKKLPKLGALVYEVSGNPFSPETQRGLESDYSTGTPSTQDRLKIVMAALVTETPPTELDSVRRRLFQSPAK
jgi:predicted nuclease with TOPRIM domain